MYISATGMFWHGEYQALPSPNGGENLNYSAPSPPPPIIPPPIDLPASLVFEYANFSARWIC
jgi:hypothetical protein